MAKPYADSTTAPIAQQPPPKTKQGAERQAELWLRWLANLHLEPRDMAAVTREAEHWRRQGQRCSPGQPWGATDEHNGLAPLPRPPIHPYHSIAALGDMDLGGLLDD
jgi:hypothetical protein